jgi:ferrous iron transport protein A
MNLLSKCTKGCTATVKKINASGPLKQRLLSFGIMKGASITMLGTSVAKSTYEVKVGKMQLALRRDEAELIEVEE